MSYLLSTILLAYSGIPTQTSKRHFRTFQVKPAASRQLQTKISIFRLKSLIFCLKEGGLTAALKNYDISDPQTIDTYPAGERYLT